MDHAVARRLGAGLAALVTWLPHPTAALGPTAPFTPPRAALEVAAPADGNGVRPSPAAALAVTAAATDGISGVRLGAAPMALIDGQWWALGSRPRGARLAGVTRLGAWLAHTDGRRELLALAAPAAGGGALRQAHPANQTKPQITQVTPTNAVVPTTATATAATAAAATTP